MNLEKRSKPSSKKIVTFIQRIDNSILKIIIMLFIIGSMTLYMFMSFHCLQLKQNHPILKCHPIWKCDPKKKIKKIEMSSNLEM